MSDTPHNEGFFSRWGRRITSLRNFIVNAVFLLFSCDSQRLAEHSRST